MSKATVAFGLVAAAAAGPVQANIPSDDSQGSQLVAGGSSGNTSDVIQLAQIVGDGDDQGEDNDDQDEDDDDQFIQQQGLSQLAQIVDEDDQGEDNDDQDEDD